MTTPELEEFARTLIHSVRDPAIESCDMQLQRNLSAPVAKRWKAAAGRDGVSFAGMIIPDIVDETVFHLLQAIDQGILRVAFVASNGKAVDLSTDGLGELSGWYMGTGGWRAMYSKQRFVDDFADLADDSARP